MSDSDKAARAQAAADVLADAIGKRCVVVGSRVVLSAEQAEMLAAALRRSSALEPREGSDEPR